MKNYTGKKLEKYVVSENISGVGKSSLLERISKGAGNIKDWASSASAGWVFYTPIMTPIEYYGAGMDGLEVLTSRLFNGILGHSIGLPLYQKSKEIMYKTFKVSEKSSKLKKGIVNALAFAPVHPPTYALLLTFSGASLEEMKIALPAGLAVVMATSPVFSPFMEWWRTKVLKQKSTYEKAGTSKENKK
ncbi:L-alanine exporter AlaE [Nanoarchaeota archaeon]